MAIFAHPYAAWLSRSASYRATLVVTYFAFGYLLVWGVLNLLQA